MIGSEVARQIWAVLRIQWLSLKNSLRRRSDRLGIVISSLMAIVWYGIWTAGAAGLFAFMMLAPRERLDRSLPGILFFILAYWQLSPLLTASMGVSIDLRKMALYPIGVHTLFLIECLLRLMTGVEMMLLLAGVSAGAAARAPRQTLVFLPLLLLFLAFNILLSAGLRNLLERLLQRRGLREAFLFLVVMASVMPQLILWSGSANRVGRRLNQAFHFLPHSILPSTSLARAYLATSTAGDWLIMAGWCAIVGAFGLTQFRRSFRFDFLAARSQTRPRTAATTWADRFYELPGRLFPDPLGALIEKELRYCVRSPRFRFLFLMGCSFGVVAWLPFAMRRSGGRVSVDWPFQSSFLSLLSLYGLLLLGQVTFLNSFGFDRSAVRYFFWMPVSPSRVLLAKNLVAEFFVVIQTIVLMGICLLLRFPVGLVQFLEALGVAGIASLYLCSAGNLTSTSFATGLSPERVSRGGAGRGIQGLMVFLYPLLISPVLAAYFVRYYWDTTRGFALLLVIAASGGLALYLATLPLAARLGYLRRERLLEDLSRGEGPLVSE